MAPAATHSALAELFNCSGKTFPLAGTGTTALEMAIANCTKRGDNVFVVSHGCFENRSIEICTRKGLNTDVLSAQWGKTIPVGDINKKLRYLESQISQLFYWV